MQVWEKRLLGAQEVCTYVRKFDPTPFPEKPDYDFFPLRLSSITFYFHYFFP